MHASPYLLEHPRESDALRRIRAVARAASAALGAGSADALACALEDAVRPALSFDALRLATYHAATDTLHYHGRSPRGEGAVACAESPDRWVVRGKRTLATGRPQDGCGAGGSAIRTQVMAGRELLGVLAAETGDPARYSAHDVEMMEALAAIAASRLAHLRLAGEHRAAADAVHASESRFRAMYRQFPLSVQIFSPDGRTVDVNEAWEELFGLTLEDTRGWNPLHEPQLAELGGLLRRAFAGETLELPPSLFDTRRAIGGDGAAAARWVQASARPVRAADGEIREVIIVHQDVTDLKEAQAALERTNCDLERRVDERTTELARANAALEEEVAEHEEAREELLRRTQELEAIFQALPDAYFRLRPDGTIVDHRAGPEWSRLVPSGDAVIRRMQEVLPPEAAERLDAALAEVERTGRLATLEHTLRTPGGEERELETRLVPLLDGDRVTVVRDITVSKAAERRLREREEHFRRLIENASDLVSIISPDGTIRYESEAIGRLFGYNAGEGVGISAWDRVHPDDRAHVEKALAEVAARPGETRSAEFRYLARDGEWRTVEAVGKTLTDNPEDGIVINTRDTTDRKEAEDALRASEERYRALIENAHDIIVVLDPATGMMKYQSPSMERILGYTPEDSAGQNMFALVHPEDLEVAMREISAAAVAPGTTGHAEYRFRHKDGSWRPAGDVRAHGVAHLGRGGAGLQHARHHGAQGGGGRAAPQRAALPPADRERAGQHRHREPGRGDDVPEPLGDAHPGLHAGRAGGDERVGADPPRRRGRGDARAGDGLRHAGGDRPRGVPLPPQGRLVALPGGLRADALHRLGGRGGGRQHPRRDRAAAGGRRRCAAPRWRRSAPTAPRASS
jgi:PAS domain S-box-containing protein